MANIVCPYCKCYTPAGSPICSRCGRDIDSVAPIVATESSSPPVAAVPTVADRRPEFQRQEILHPEFHRAAVPIQQSRALALSDERIRVTEERIDRETLSAIGGSLGREPVLEYDRLCMLFENLAGTVRMRFNPNRAGVGLRNVRMSFQSLLSGETVNLPVIVKANMPRPLIAQFPAQTPGQQSWQVRVEYESDRRKRTLEGQIEILVIRPEEAKQAATNLSISIDNSVHVGDHSANAADITTRGGLIGDYSANAADIQMRRNIAEALERLTRSSNPFDELRSLIQSDKRLWTQIELFDADAVDTLPPMPANARTDRVALSIDGRLIHLYSNRMVKFGRKRECNDFVIRPPVEFSEAQEAPYRRVSREHCYFEHSGRTVLISDGSRSPTGVLRPSSTGTFWNGRKIENPVEVPSGSEGVVSFGGVRRCAPNGLESLRQYESLCRVSVGRQELERRRKPSVSHAFPNRWSLGEIHRPVELFLPGRRRPVIGGICGVPQGWGIRLLP